MKKLSASLKNVVKAVAEGNKQFVHSLHLTRMSYYLDNCSMLY